MSTGMKDNIISYWSGFTGTFGYVFLQIDTPASGGVIIKFIVGISIAFFGGIAGVAGKDIYQWIKSKLNKNGTNNG